MTLYTESRQIAGLRTHSLAFASIRVFVLAVAVQLCFGQAGWFRAKKLRLTFLASHLPSPIRTSCSPSQANGTAAALLSLSSPALLGFISCLRRSGVIASLRQ
jgi:hypothetical protein